MVSKRNQNKTVLIFEFSLSMNDDVKLIIIVECNDINNNNSYVYNNDLYLKILYDNKYYDRVNLLMVRCGVLPPLALVTSFSQMILILGLNQDTRNNNNMNNNNMKNNNMINKNMNNNTMNNKNNNKNDKMNNNMNNNNINDNINEKNNNMNNNINNNTNNNRNNDNNNVNGLNNGLNKGASDPIIVSKWNKDKVALILELLLTVNNGSFLSKFSTGLFTLISIT